MKKIITTLLTFVMVFSLFSIPSSAYSNEGVEGFVARCYDIALGREPDDESLKGWCDQLRNGDACGVSVAFGFVYSPEFQNAGFDNATYVEKMYNMLLGRASDKDGKAYWVQQLDAGANREDIFFGFANSTEFFDLCSSYGIYSGYYIPGVGMQRNADINGFVDRLYRICLGRHGDMGSQAGYVQQLAAGAVNGSAVATNFVFSAEYMDNCESITDFVTTLYQAILGRNPDEPGLNAWADNYLSSYWTLEQLFDGFANSAEFDSICSEYGIVKGTSTLGRNIPSLASVPSNVGPGLALIKSQYDSIFPAASLDHLQDSEIYRLGYVLEDAEIFGWFDDINGMGFDLYSNTVDYIQTPQIVFAYTVDDNNSESVYYEIYNVSAGYALVASGNASPKMYIEGNIVEFNYGDRVNNVPAGSYLIVATNASKTEAILTVRCNVLS